MKRIFVGMVLAGLAGMVSAAECPPDRSAVIKEGHFGAKNVRAYNVMISLQVRQQVEDLEEMVASGMVIQLPPGERACIRRDVATSFRTWVTVPGHEGTYWVHSNALER